MDSDPRATHDEPLVVDIHGGEVVITGPGAVSIALTAQAAAQTAMRLAKAAQMASEAPAADRIHYFKPGPT